MAKKKYAEMNDEEKALRKANIKRDIIGAVIVVIILYFLMAVVLSALVGQFVHVSVENMGENNPYPGQISDEDFKDLAWSTYKTLPASAERLREMLGYENISESTFRTPVFTLFGPTGGRSYYIFHYGAKSYNDSILTDSYELNSMNASVEVRFAFSDGKIVITEVNNGEVGTAGYKANYS